MLHIGFTGTRHGMTPAQKRSLVIVLGQSEWMPELPWTIHHGDCVGADEQFHDYIVSCYGKAEQGHCTIAIHPGPPSEFTANCKGDERRQWKPHMRRNADIVAESDVMMAAPAEMTEQKCGGTWATIRMARRAGKPLAIVWPDGSVTKERWP